MILTLTNLTEDARDLGHLLHKHPDRVYQEALSSGLATVFYPEADSGRCTAVLVVEVDSVALVRSPVARQGGWALGQYVNDRPFVASSFLSVAMAAVFGTALNGRCAKRPELVDRPLSLEINVPVVAAPGGADQLHRLFDPLGYNVEVGSIPLDECFPDWGPSRYAGLTLRVCRPLHEVLKHLFVILPALDRAKHYWVGEAEVAKLLDKGDGWLAAHPERDWITRRYLKDRPALTRDALARLVPEDSDDVEEEDAVPEESRIPLHDQRLDVVARLLAAEAPASILDLGCGEGKLLARLLKETAVPRVTGMDVDGRALRIARERLEKSVPAARRESRLTLIQGSLLYRDSRLDGHDAAALVEVIEHLDPGRLAALERMLFEGLRPRLVVVTTPNCEYNVLYEGLTPSAFRHRDHRFEWTRAEFADWARRVAERRGYHVELSGLGEANAEHGAPSQMAVFRLIQSGTVEGKAGGH